MKSKLHKAVDTITLMSLNNLKRKQFLSQHLKNNLSYDEISAISASILQLQPQQRNQTDLEILIKATEKITFFKNLEESNGQKCLMNCLKYLFLEKLDQDQIVFHQGEFATKFYIILSGTVDIYIKQRNKKDQLKVNSLSNGDSFGELALINDAPRMATVKTVTTCQFGVLKKQDYKEILAKEQARQLERQMYELQSIPTLDKLSRKGLQMLIYTFEQKQFKYSQIVYKEGDASDDLIYIIREGEFKIIKNIMKSTKDINEFKQKQHKMIKLEVCIIGKDTIFGEEEPFSKLSHRQFTVQCNSLVAQTYVVSLSEMKKRISLSNEQHVISFMQNLNESKSRWRKILTLKMAYIHSQVKKQSSKNLQRPRTSIKKEQINEQNVSRNQRCGSATSFYQNLLEFKSTLNLQDPQQGGISNENERQRQSQIVPKKMIKKTLKKKSFQVSKYKNSSNSSQLTPEQMRKLHEQQIYSSHNTRMNKFRPQSLQKYINRNKQPLQQESLLYDSINQVSQQGQTIYQTIQSNSNQPQSRQYRTIQQHNEIQFSIEKAQNNQNLNLTIDLKERQNNKLDLVKKNKQKILDTSLIVDSRNSVLSRFKQKRSESLKEKNQNESIVYVPCGITSLRAKQWPIRADLFVMKMNKQEDKQQNSIIENVKEKYAVQNLMKSEKDNQELFIQRLQSVTYRYQPNHVRRQLQDDFGFVNQFH